MTNKAKQLSDDCGKTYLKQVLEGVEEKMQFDLRHEKVSTTHDATMGANCEVLWRDLLSRYLPDRYRVEEAFVIDSRGNTSDQQDIVIFDPLYTAPLHGHNKTKYLPRECIYAVFEAKQSVSKANLEYAGKKMESVTSLYCTSAEMVSSGRTVPARDIFRPLTGLVANDTTWSNGLHSDAFSSNLPESEESRLDFVITAHSGFYDGQREVCSGRVITGKNSMMRGIFRLLDALQKLGTVPAIDWSIYEDVLTEKYKGI